jgi:hypothetical protein
MPPNGCAGGRSGRPGDILINPGGKEEKRLPSRYADYPLRAGDAFRLDTPGGGGLLDRETGSLRMLLTEEAFDGPPTIGTPSITTTLQSTYPFYPCSAAPTA